MHFDLADLRLFIHIAESPSLTQGARRAFLSPAAASARVKALEGQLGSRLLYRDSRGVELTPAGQRLLQHARLIMRQVEYLKSEFTEYGSDAALLERLEEWLPAYLGKVTRLAHFANLDLASILAGLLPWPLPQRLDEWAPKTLEVPSGSRIRLDYSETPPILAVRLQELFGLGDTPRIAQGRLAVKLHLLSPAHRPVQVTQDLANFWRSTYAEVRKDLKGRYPKLFHKLDPWVESLNNKKIDR